jgi:hypothetical protein
MLNEYAFREATLSSAQLSSERSSAILRTCESEIPSPDEFKVAVAVGALGPVGASSQLAKRKALKARPVTCARRRNARGPIARSVGLLEEVMNVTVFPLYATGTGKDAQRNLQSAQSQIERNKN